jgi:uncharacterized membrane protein YsdA (DUF1294 family)
MKEQSFQHIIVIYLVVINVATFFTYGIDKWKAKCSKWRIREVALLVLAILGGSVGAWLGMKVWHHKTQHKKFKYGIPIILIVQIAILLLTSCKTKQVVELSKPFPESKYTPEHSPNVFLLMYDAEVGKEPLLKAIKDYKCEIVYDYGIINGMALKKPEDKSLEETMQYFKKVKGVTNVEYDHVICLTDPVKPRLEIK